MGAVKLGSSSLRKIVAALLRLLRPSCPDIGTTDKDPVAGAMSLDWLASVGMPSFSYATASFSSPGVPALLCRTFHVSHVFSEDAVRRATTASLWLIWPEDGCASIA
jgi:hypothetical protein